MRRLIGGAVLAALVCCPATASADWSTPHLLSPRPPASAQFPQIAVGSAGDLLAAWFQTSTPALAGTWRVHGMESRAPGVTYTALGAPISDPGAQPAYNNLSVDVAPNGAAGVAWVQGGDRDLTVASRPGGFGTVFGVPRTLTRPAGSAACPNNSGLKDNGIIEPVVAMGSGGGHVGWMSPCGNTENGRWMKFAPISPDGTVAEFGSIAGRGAVNGGAGTLSGPQLLRNEATGFGRLVFLAPSPNPGVVEYTLNQGAVAGQPATIEPSTPTRNLGTTRNAQLKNGDLITIWRNTQVSPAAIEIRVGADAPRRLNPADQDGIAPEVAAGGDGTIVATWKAASGATAGSYWAAVRRPDTKQWGAAHQISDTTTLNPLRLAISDVGVAYAVWANDTASLNTIEASILDPRDPDRSPGKPWQFQPVPETLVDGHAMNATDGKSLGDADYPVVAVAPDGRAWVAFRTVTGVDPVTFATGLVRSPISYSTTPPPPKPTPTPAPAGGAPPPPPPAARDTTPPRITVLNTSRQRFAVGSKLDKVVADRGERSVGVKKLKSALRVGTTFKWTQNEAGRSAISISHIGCWTLTRVGDAKVEAPVCKRKKLDGVVFKKTVKAKLGANSLKFLGKKGLVRGAELKLNGRYRVTVLPTDAAGNRGTGRSITFEIDGPLLRK